MPHVMSLIIFPMSIGSMLHVNFKKWPCRSVEFKGQEPWNWVILGSSDMLHKIKNDSHMETLHF